MRRCEVEERDDRPTIELVAPRVDHGRDALHPERDAHVTGDRVGIDEQDALALVDQHRAQVGGDHRLADATLGVEQGDQLAAAAPVRRLELTLQDGSRAVVNDHGPDAHGLHPPSDGLGGVRARQVLVVLVALAHEVEGVQVRGVDDQERRDRPATRVEQGPGVVHEVCLDLGIDDPDGHVGAGRQQCRELASPVERDRVEATGMELGDDGVALRLRQQEGDDRPAVRGGHSGQPSASGSRAVTWTRPSAVLVTRAAKPGMVGTASRKETSG